MRLQFWFFKKQFAFTDNNFGTNRNVDILTKKKSKYEQTSTLTVSSRTEVFDIRDNKYMTGQSILL